MLKAWTERIYFQCYMLVISFIAFLRKTCNKIQQSKQIHFCSDGRSCTFSWVFAVEENGRVFGRRKVNVIQGSFLISVHRILNLIKCWLMNTRKNVHRNKSQLIAMVLSQKNETTATIESLRDEVKEMNTNFKKLRLMLVLLKQLAIFLWKSQLIQSGSSGQMPSTLVENASIYTTTEP